MKRALSVLLALAACRANPPAQSGAQGPRRELEFLGASRFPLHELEAAVDTDLGEVADRKSPKSAVDDAAYALVEFYRARGFPDCTVEYELVEVTPAHLRARFTIVEGVQTLLAGIELVGNARFDRAELLAAAGFSDEPRPYVESELAHVADALAAHYLSKGYLDVRVTEPQVELDDSHEHARATIRVEEGACYRLAAAPRVEGGVPAIDAAVDTSDRIGKALAPRTLVDLRGRVEELYQQRGYPEVTVDALPPTLDEKGGAQLTFRVVPGERVVISELNVVGNAKTRTAAVLAHVKLAKGDVYDVRAVRESFRELYRTGLFSRVRLDVDTAGGSLRPLRIEVEEAPSTELFVEPGLGSYEGPRFLVGWREHNLLGTARSLQLEGLMAQRTQRAIVGVSDPRLFDSEFLASLSVFGEVRDEPSFDSDERGAALAFSREFTPRLRVTGEYRFRRSEISNVDITDPLAVAELNDVDLSSLGVSASWDSRDSVFVPSRGMLLKASFEYADSALGSELEFVRGKGTLARFVELADGRVFAMSWRAGAITPFDSTSTIPVQERFFNGGENTVRSFGEDELGPRDSNGNALGGQSFHVLSAEMRQRLSGALEGALFVDAGNLEPDASDLLAFEHFRYALGVGVRYVLPIGPVRLDFGWNPDQHSGESAYAAHFSVGMSF